MGVATPRLFGLLLAAEVYKCTSLACIGVHSPRLLFAERMESGSRTSTVACADSMGYTFNKNMYFSLADMLAMADRVFEWRI